MRGRPILQWFCFVLVWTAMLYPILCVTRRDGAVDVDSTSEAETQTAWISVRFSAIPERFEFRQDGVLLWAEPSPAGMEFERECPVRFDAFGAELALVASVPETNVAVEVSLVADGRPERSETVWGSGYIKERVPFSWRDNVR